MKSNLFKKMLVLVLALMLVFTVVACNPDDEPEPGPGPGPGPGPTVNKITAAKFFDELWASANQIGKDAVNPEENYGFEFGLVLEVAIGDQVLPIDIDLKLFVDVEDEGANTAVKIDLGLSFINATIFYFMEEPDMIYGIFGSDTTLYKLPLTINADESVGFEGNDEFPSMIYDLLNQDILSGKSINDILSSLAASFGPKGEIPYSLNDTIDALLKALGLDLYQTLMVDMPEIGETISQLLGITFEEGKAFDLHSALVQISKTLNLEEGRYDSTGTQFDLTLSGGGWDMIPGMLIGMLEDYGLDPLFTRYSDISVGFTRADNTSGSLIESFYINILTPEFMGSDDDLSITITIDKLGFANVDAAPKAYLGATGTAKYPKASLVGSAVVSDGLLILNLPSTAWDGNTEGGDNFATSVYTGLDIGGTHTLNLDIALDLSDDARAGGNNVLADINFEDGSKVRVTFSPKADDKKVSTINVTLTAAGEGTAARAVAQNIAMALANWFIEDTCVIMVDGEDISNGLSRSLAEFASSTTATGISIPYEINIQELISGLITGMFSKTNVSIQYADPVTWKVNDKDVTFSYANAVSVNDGAVEFTVKGNNTLDVTTLPVVRVDGSVITTGLEWLDASEADTGNSATLKYTPSGLAKGNHTIDIDLGDKTYSFGFDSIVGTDVRPSGLSADRTTFSKVTGGVNNKDVVVTAVLNATGATIAFVNVTDAEGNNVGVTPNIAANEKVFTFKKANLAALDDGKYNLNFTTSIGETLAIEIEVVRSNIDFKIAGIFNILLAIKSSSTEFSFSSANLLVTLEGLLGEDFMGDTSLINADMAEIVDESSAINSLEALLDGASGTITITPVENGLFKLTIDYKKGKQESEKTAKIELSLLISDRNAA